MPDSAWEVALFRRDIWRDCAFIIFVKFAPFLLLGLSGAAWTYGQEEFLPTIENSTPSGALPFGGNQPVAGDDREVLVPAVSTLVLSTSDVTTRFDAGVVRLSGVTVANGAELAFELRSFLNRPLTEQSLLTLTEIIVSHYEENDQPVVEVWVPPQDERYPGQLVVRVVEGRVGQVQLRETVHFNNARLSSALQLQSGQLLRASDLTETTAWLSRNPFRKAELFAAAGSREGEADLVFAIEEQRPWRAYVAYENTGTKATGESRFLLGGVWGNAFEQDHILAYQATLGADPGQFQAHGLSWEIPIHHRHEFLRFSASWASVHADSSTDLGPADIEGTSWQTSLQYGRQILADGWQGEVFGGVDFKRSDTFLTFGDFVGLTSDAPVEVVQFKLGGLLRKSADRAAGWNHQYRAELVASPGGLSGRNHDDDFAAYRSDADPSYLYLRANGKWSRGWRDCTVLLRAEAQLASGALLPSEQLGLGGMRTIRGYRERDYLADSGWWGSVEVRGPAWSTDLLEKELSAQALGFLDHGFTWRDDEDSDQLLSFGVGLRAQWGAATVSADFGVPLTDDADPRAHLGLTYLW
ncbi:ShlB/FhaC/HecB family hemolysin secretion/activation protein [Roseibacillus persicicus]|uniref:ShlB/FhaC/HecB family hemolysin secretion/activation protein n=1 Tax=Roseibacillus persicicus TaxID=454148 RepID=UPI00398AE44E